MISEQWLKGYTQAELDSAQRRFDLEFPPDLIALLREKRPANGHDWTNDAEIRRALAWPFEGLLFDVAINRHARAEVDTIDRAPVFTGRTSRARQSRILRVSGRRDLLRSQFDGLF
jgi:hypothetical protein